MSGTAKVTTGGADWLDATVELYKDAFAADPVLLYFVNGLTEARRAQHFPHLMRTLVQAGAMNDGVFYYARQEAYAHGEGKTLARGCRGVLMPPGASPDNPLTFLAIALSPKSVRLGLAAGLVRLPNRMLNGFEAQSHRAKKKALKKRERYYYMYWLATDESERGKGLASEVIRAMQKRAEQDGAPLWTEASTPRSAKLYASLGFKAVETFMVGKGEADEKGHKKAGGEGVPVVAMIWRPPQQ